jgi:hypothetical protein
MSAENVEVVRRLQDRQNKELLNLSKQILQLTKEVRSYGETQNNELRELSREMLALRKEGPS